MGQVTPNMGIYIPAAGETNYDASFAAGMVNIDQHDHSGGPNKGVPIATSGIADGSITYPKLNANVVDTTSGLGTHTGGLANQITTTGLLLSLAQLAVNGMLSKSGTNVNARTITGTANQIAVTNGDGVSGDPTLALAAPVRIPTNPAFQAYNNAPVADVTGDGTLFTVTWNAESFDRANNFASPNFTAPVDGVYYLTASLVLTDLAVGHVSGLAYLESSAGDIQWGFRGNPYAMSDGGVLAIECNGIFNLTAGQTVNCKLQISGGAKVVDVFGAALSTGPSSFEGALLS